MDKTRRGPDDMDRPAPMIEMLDDVRMHRSRHQKYNDKETWFDLKEALSKIMMRLEDLDDLEEYISVQESFWASMREEARRLRNIIGPSVPVWIKSEREEDDDDGDTG